MQLSQLSPNEVLQSVPVDELQRWVNDYPYFAPAHYFLSAKLNETGSSDANQQLQRTALYFNNTFWLQYQLSKKVDDIIILPVKPQPAVVKPLLENVVKEELENNIAAAKAAEIIVEPVVIAEPIVVAEEIVETPVQPEIATVVEAIVEVPQTMPTTVVNIVEESTETAALVAEPPAEESTTAPTIVAEQVTETPAEEPEDDYEEEAELNEEILDMQAEKVSSLLDAELAEFKKPVTETTNLNIESEPYHAVDYFAALGIKVDLDLPPHDKLTSQLRKFTDWLKHMKKIQSDEENVVAIDPELENAIQGIAKTSNESRDVVTEAMAEILEKQGKKDKAIQLYIKLSFLNPDKSAYFADKIQHLKGI